MRLIQTYIKVLADPAAGSRAPARAEETIEVPGQGPRTASTVRRLEADLEIPAVRTLITLLAQRAPAPRAWAAANVPGTVRAYCRARGEGTVSLAGTCIGESLAAVEGDVSAMRWVRRSAWLLWAATLVVAAVGLALPSVQCQASL